MTPLNQVRPYRVWAEIDLDAVRHNLSVVRRVVGHNVAIMAVVKANAYGHGAVSVAQTLAESGVRMFAVADLNEAIELREAGIRQQIVILGTLFDSQLPTALAQEVTPLLHSQSQVKLLASFAARNRRPLPVHLMIDTGMGRLGVAPHKAAALATAIDLDAWLELEGVATHLSCADVDDTSFTDMQLGSFEQALSDIRNSGCSPRYVHAAASSALFRFPQARYSLCRPGLALYGLAPHSAGSIAQRLRPAMSVYSRIVHLKDVQAGAALSYRATHRCRVPTRIATVPMGYADGYPLSASNKGAEVVIRGQRAPVVGRVTMDYVLVDVGAIPGVQVGDQVNLLGGPTKSVGAHELADWADTIAYEITCRIGRRVCPLHLGQRSVVRRRARVLCAKDLRDKGRGGDPGRQVPHVPARPQHRRRP